MLIARVIANRSDLLTSIEALKHTLEACGLMISVSAQDCGVDVLLEVQTFDGSAAALRAAVEEHFPQSDMLIARDRIALPAVLVSDMDSTMIEQECIDELADFAGLKAEIAQITERAMQGEIAFEEALRGRVALLEGLEADCIARCLEERISYTKGARTLVQTLRAKGCRCVLVTGGFHHFADPIGAAIGFDKVVGNQLAVRDGRLSGALVGEVVDAGTKRAVLLEEAGRLPAGSVTLACGDGANDIPMLKTADYGFAYHAKPLARASANGVIDAADLTAILKLLGIPAADWTG